MQLRTFPSLNMYFYFRGHMLKKKWEVENAN